MKTLMMKRRISGKKIVCCDLCLFNVSNDAGLQMHIKRVHNEKKKPVEKTIKTNTNENTYDEKVNPNEKIFHCELCPFDASNDAGLQMHIKRVHNEKKTVEKTIKTNTYETTLMMKRKILMKKIFRCDLCPLNASKLVCHSPEALS